MSDARGRAWERGGNGGSTGEERAAAESRGQSAARARERANSSELACLRGGSATRRAMTRRTQQRTRAQSGGEGEHSSSSRRQRAIWRAMREISATATIQATLLPLLDDVPMNSQRALRVLSSKLWKARYWPGSSRGPRESRKAA